MDHKSLSLHCVQAFSGVGRKFPNESVAVMRWAICDLLSIKAETYQIIETPFISISEFPFSFSRHEVRTAGAELWGDWGAFQRERSRLTCFIVPWTQKKGTSVMWASWQYHSEGGGQEGGRKGPVSSSPGTHPHLGFSERILQRVVCPTSHLTRGGEGGRASITERRAFPISPPPPISLQYVLS